MSETSISDSTTCVNCGEELRSHGHAGAARMCRRQFYFAPTPDHPNARRTAPSPTPDLRELAREIAVYFRNRQAGRMYYLNDDLAHVLALLRSRIGGGR
jgi:hypothetical protein